MKFCIAAIAAVSLGSAAFASTSDNPFGQDSAVLTLSGLDLATADGQQRLAIRVEDEDGTCIRDEKKALRIDRQSMGRVGSAGKAIQKLSVRREFTYVVVVAVESVDHTAAVCCELFKTKSYVRAFCRVLEVIKEFE